MRIGAWIGLAFSALCGCDAAGKKCQTGEGVNDPLLRWGACNESCNGKDNKASCEKAQEFASGACASSAKEGKVNRAACSQACQVGVKTEEKLTVGTKVLLDDDTLMAKADGDKVKVISRKTCRRACDAGDKSACCAACDTWDRDACDANKECRRPEDMPERPWGPSK